MSRWTMCVSEIIRSLPQRAHTMRRNQLGKAVAARPGPPRPMAAVVAVAAPVPSRDRPGGHQAPGGRTMRAKNALISGEASWPSEIVQRHQDGKHRSGRPLRLPIRGSEHQEQRAVRHDAIMAIARPWAQRAVKSIPISLTRMLGSALALAPRTWMQQFGARPTEDAGVTKRPRL
jgi:hypothetical protein